MATTGGADSGPPPSDGDAAAEEAEFEVNLEVERLWREVRSRLERVLGARSELAAALGAYAADHQDDLRLSEVRGIREEYGTRHDPTAERLFPLLFSEDSGGR